MTLEDSMNSLFTVNIPSEHHVEVGVDSIEGDDSYTLVIPQQILEYFAAKLKGVGSKSKLVYNPDIIGAYKNAVAEFSSHFVCMRVNANSDHEASVAMVQYFHDDTQVSFNIAGSLVYRLGKLVSMTGATFFEEVLSREEEQEFRSGSIPSTILSMHLGRDVLSEYNSDPDGFISKIAEALLYSIIDNTFEESHGGVDLSEFAD